MRDSPRSLERRVVNGVDEAEPAVRTHAWLLDRIGAVVG